MMVAVLRSLALLLVVAVPSAALAQRGGSRPSAPAPRAPAPVSRPIPAARPAAPVSRGGFNFNRDISAPAARVPQPAARVPQPAARAPQPAARAPQPAARAAGTFPHAAYTAGGAGPYARRFHGPVLRSPRIPGQPWGWNHGVVWVPAPIYWGGGFWGPWAIASLSTAILFGSIIDYDNQIIYPSYEVEPDSAGAQVLAAYELQQTQCGPPNLVVIWGPDNSVICAFPSALVGPGNYELDPSTLTLISESP